MRFLGLFIEEKKKKEELVEVTVSSQGETYLYEYRNTSTNKECAKKPKEKKEQK